MFMYTSHGLAKKSKGRSKIVLLYFEILISLIASIYPRMIGRMAGNLLLNIEIVVRYACLLSSSTISQTTFQRYPIICYPKGIQHLAIYYSLYPSSGDVLSRYPWYLPVCCFMESRYLPICYAVESSIRPSTVRLYTVK